MLLTVHVKRFSVSRLRDFILDLSHCVLCSVVVSVVYTVGANILVALLRHNGCCKAALTKGRGMQGEAVNRKVKQSR